MITNIDYIHFYVPDAQKWQNWLTKVMGLRAIASGNDGNTHTEVVGNHNGKIIFILSSPLTANSPVTRYFSKHPSGVADVAFRVDNVAETVESAKAYGATLLHPIDDYITPNAHLKWCRILGKSGLIHTLIERQGQSLVFPYDELKSVSDFSCSSENFEEIDHVVLNVPQGELSSTVAWYEKVFGFERQQNFEIQTTNSGLSSQVLKHPPTGIQMPINEPSSRNSQIQEFIDFNRGAGVQHIALKTKQITNVIMALQQAGLSFLEVPQTYYEQLETNGVEVNFSPQEWERIKQNKILVDLEEKDPQNSLLSKAKYPLFLQIFTLPIFEKPTFFFEMIERRDEASGFGEGNFQALFEAIEQEQEKRGSLAPKNLY